MSIATTSHSIARLFEDFNSPGMPLDAADAPPPEPTFDAAELSAARQEAWNDGFLAASAAAAIDIGREERRVFEALLARADDIDKSLGLMAAHNAAAIADWLVMTFITTFPDLAKDALTDRTRAVADLLQPVLRSQSKIEVRGESGSTVSCHSMHDVCRQIAAQQSEDPSGGTIIVAWQQGEAEIDPSRTWQDIRSAIMPVAAGGTADGSFELTVKQGEFIRHVG
jgi:hypothetical protein